MQELMFRLNYYFFYQFVYAATDANPYSDIYERLTVEVDPFADHTAAKQSSAAAGAERRHAKSSVLLGKIEESNESNGSYGDGQSSRGADNNKHSIYKPETTNGQGSSESDDDSQESSNQSMSSCSPRDSRIRNKKKSKKSRIVNMNYESNKEESAEDQNSNEIPDEEDYDFNINDDLGGNSASYNERNKNFNFKMDSEEFDLKQYPFTTGLDIMIENPVIVLKDTIFRR